VLEADRFELLFGTPHGVDLSVLGSAHGLLTVEPAGAADVATAIRARADAGGTRIVRIATDRSTNVAHHERIHAAVAQAVERALEDDADLR
jgi:2-succinyl-5-enolpyruvyl-6-hydroxy-3-cyclohexene-1-carboxylate synthase